MFPRMENGILDQLLMCDSMPLQARARVNHSALMISRIPTERQALRLCDALALNYGLIAQAVIPPTIEDTWGVVAIDS